MEENLKVPYSSTQKCKSIDDETRKVKEFVYKHLRDMTGGSFFNSEGSSTNGLGGSIKKEKLSLSKTHCKIQQGAVFSGKILSFECSVCKDSTTYSPNDLLKHFRAVHKETLPTYPCDLCCFVTHEFPALQRHRIEHRNTLVTCELCSDGVQYSLLLLTRHYIMCHSQNGQFNCDWCEFITFDAGTFVQHIHHHNESPWKCSKCRHISLNENDYKKHVKAHLGSFPFTCEICGYGTTTSESLANHLAAVHKDEAEKMNGWIDTEDSSSYVAPSAGAEVLLNSDSQDIQKLSRVNHVAGSLSNQSFRLTAPELSMEETYHLMDTTVAKRENKMWTKGSHNTDLTVLQDFDGLASFDVSGKSNSNGLTVLMVRNKISLPPNCTTKVVGFKMVDGKKHLVLKVIPAGKQLSSTNNHPSPESVCSFAPPQVDNSTVGNENGESASCKKSISDSFEHSPKSMSCMQTNPDEIVAVKVKIEEEETSVCNLDTSSQTDVESDTSPLLQRCCLDASCSSSDNCNHVILRSKEATGFDSSIFSPSVYSGATGQSGLTVSYISNISSHSVVAQETVPSEQVSKNTVENCRAADELPVTDPADQIDEFQSLSSIKDNFEQISGKDKLGGIHIEIEHKSEDDSAGRNSQSQEVFTFHNYFKEKLNPSPNTIQNCSTMYKDSLRKERIEGVPVGSAIVEPLDTFPQSLDEEALDQDQQDFDKLSECNDIIDKCVVEDSSGEDGSLESIFQDFNIIKIEEDIVPISPEQSGAKNYSSPLDSFDKKPSDALINQEPDTANVHYSSASCDLLDQTKESCQISPSPENKQPVLPSTTEVKSVMPVQAKDHPGFKLITSSTPQINVSYFRTAQEKSCNQGCANLNPISRRLHVPAQKTTAENKTTLAVQSSDRQNSNNFLINHLGLKSPLILSQSLHRTSTKKTKTQPTCYLLQRPLPPNESSSTSSVKLAGTQLQLNSRPVLAMSVSSANKLGALQPGQQAFLLRYISPTKSGLLLNNQDGKLQTHGSETGDGIGNKVIFKIVTPTTSLTNGTCTSNTQPLFMPASPPTQCFLVSSNKNPTEACSGMKKLIALQSTTHKAVKETLLSHARIDVSAPLYDIAEPVLAPRPIRPPSQRKRRRKQLFDELPELMHKARKLSKKTETTLYWKPVSKEVERTLRLAPFSCLQQVRCPRRNQPVVVLNHPDADIPEVANIMKVVNRHKGAVSKVVLSQKTLQALSEMSSPGDKPFTKGILSHRDRPRPVQSSVREQFLLRLKLRKKSRKKYEVVKSLPSSSQTSVAFDCWFCGRLFNSQEDWIGHGQRHLMEATRDWNKLF